MKSLLSLSLILLALSLNVYAEDFTKKFCKDAEIIYVNIDKNADKIVMEEKIHGTAATRVFKYYLTVQGDEVSINDQASLNVLSQASGNDILSAYALRLTGIDDFYNTFESVLYIGKDSDDNAFLFEKKGNFHYLGSETKCSN